MPIFHLALERHRLAEARRGESNAPSAMRAMALLALLPLIAGSVSSGASASSSSGFPTLPSTMTPVQQAVQARAATISAASAPAARPAVTALLGSAATKKYLRQFDDGSRLAELTGAQLLRRLDDELEAAELVHNFGFSHPQSCGVDVSMADGPRMPQFVNQWALQTPQFQLAPIDPGNNRGMEVTEVGTWGFTPFANISEPDLATAVDRPVYAALNLYRDSMANFQCGPVAAVFNREFVGSRAVGFPCDTGNMASNIHDHPGYCTANVPPRPGLVEGNWSECFNCKDCVRAGTRPMAVPGKGQMTHLLLPYLSYFNVTALAEQDDGAGTGAVVGADYVSYNAARLLTRLLSRETYRRPASALRLNWFENTWGYFEINPLVAVPMSRRGIKFMVASFSLLFGRPQGAALRAWCTQKGWPLVWAHNPYVASWCTSVDGGDPIYANCSNACWPVAGQCQWATAGTRPGRMPPGCDSCTAPQDRVARRVLDPAVLARVPEGHNCTGGADKAFQLASRGFERAWASVAARHVDAAPFPHQRLELMDAYWANITAVEGGGESHSPLGVEPMFAGACADRGCIGVRTADAKCVCAAAADHRT